MYVAEYLAFFTVLTADIIKNSYKLSIYDLISNNVYQLNIHCLYIKMETVFFHRSN